VARAHKTTLDQIIVGVTANHSVAKEARIGVGMKIIVNRQQNMATLQLLFLMTPAAI
jgi:hypothetical protein